MNALFEELDYRPTPMGVLTLRRRALPGGEPVYEIKLDEEFLMSSRFTGAEVALGRLGVDACTGDMLDVAVGGLGLGYTARAALESARVDALVVVEALAEVIGWHKQGLLPLGAELCGDARCRLVHGDFFALAADPACGLDPDNPGRRFDAILLDVDHAPDNVLHPSHAAFYTQAGLQNLAAQLKPGGVFALWSNDPPDAAFMHILERVFASAEAPSVAVGDDMGESAATNTVYIARASG